MASWVKIVNTLPRSRSIYALMRKLRCKRQAALGLAVDWLCWLDVNSTNGETGMLDDEISDVLGWQGAAEALSAIGWVSHDEQGYVVALDFEKHNGETAKKRAEDAERQRKSRGKRDKCHGKSVTDVTAETRPDKIREDKSNIEVEHYTQDREPNAEAARAGAVPAQAPAEGGGNEAPGHRLRPADAGEVEAHLSGLAVLKLTPAERQKAALLFFNEMESVGWIDPKGRAIRDWKTSACNFAIRYGENAHTPFRAGRQEGGYSRNDKNANGKGVNNYDIR